ncbi:hypothetical protein Tco_0128678 [Tanacetum coccineum]
MQKLQSLLSQQEIHGPGISTEDVNQKFLRVFESDVKGSTASSSSIQNVAFISENTRRIRKRQWEKIWLKQERTPNALVTLDGEGVELTSHSDSDEQMNHAFDGLQCEETHESMPEPVVNKPKVVSEPKVWSDAPIIARETESISEDEHVSLPTKEHEIPKLKRTNTVNTARHNFNSQAVPINAARKVNTVKPIVNNARPKAGFHKSVSPFRNAVKEKGKTAVKIPQQAHDWNNKATLAEYQDDFNGRPLPYEWVLSFTYLTNTNKDDSEIPALEEIYDNQLLVYACSRVSRSLQNTIHTLRFYKETSLEIYTEGKPKQVPLRESLERDIDGTEELLLPDLFILWLTKVSTDSAKLIPLGKDSTAIKTLEKIPPRV